MNSCPKNARQRKRSASSAAAHACAAAAVALALAAAPAAQAASAQPPDNAYPVEVVNGDFAQPHQVGQYTSIAPATGIEGWTLIGSGIDMYSETLCNRDDDQQCLDLNNQYSPGGLSQVLHVTPGAWVHVKFESTRSMYGSCYNWGPNGGAVPFNVKIEGKEPYRVDPPARSSAQPAVWESHNVSFLATKATHRLTFESVQRTQGTCGAVIADVSAFEVY